MSVVRRRLTPSCRIRLLALVLAACCSAGANAEELLDLGQGVTGMLTRASAAAIRNASRQPAVLILHGWNDHMDGVGGLQAKLADALARKGVGSLRINFRGEGERNAFVTSSTHRSRLEDAALAYRVLTREFPGGAYGVLGWSLGALTAMSLAGEHPDWFGAMVLWSGADTHAGGEPEQNAAIREAIRTGEASFRSWATFTLTREHLVSFIGVDAREGLASYPGSFLSIRGDRDNLPSHDRDWLQRLSTDDKSFLLIGGADHVFNVLGPEPELGSRAVDATAAWFVPRLRP